MLSSCNRPALTSILIMLRFPTTTTRSRKFIVNKLGALREPFRSRSISLCQVNLDRGRGGEGGGSSVGTARDS